MTPVCLLFLPKILSSRLSEDYRPKTKVLEMSVPAATSSCLSLAATSGVVKAESRSFWFLQPVTHTNTPSSLMASPAKKPVSPSEPLTSCETSSHLLFTLSLALTEAEILTTCSRVESRVAARTASSASTGETREGSGRKNCGRGGTTTREAVASLTASRFGVA
jgi:hypothetical protein